MTRLLPALRASLLVVALGAFVPVAVADTAAHERLTRIAHAYIDAIAADDPIAATALGLPGADGTLVIPSEAARAARIARLRAWRAEVEAVAGAVTTLVDANDARLLGAEFDSALNELLVREGDRKDYAGPSLRLVDTLFVQFLHLPVVGRDGARQADVDRAWDDIVARLEQGPAFIVAGQRMVTRPGRLFGTVGSRRIARALLLAEPPSIAAGEVTDKGYVNQRAVLERRAALVEQLYGSEPAPERIVLPP